MLIALAIDAEDGLEQSGMTKADAVDVCIHSSPPDDSSLIQGNAPTQRIVNLLMARRDMLQEYFSLGISENGLIETLPMLLRDYTPNLDKLPLFLMRLGPQVDWTEE